MRLLVWCWLASLWLLASAENDTQPISIFRSRPDLVSPILSVFNRTVGKQAPGYYFISPFQQVQETVYIYDNEGNLVYTGFGSLGPGISHAPQTCQYKGETHLCFYQGTQMMGWGHGHGVIVDKHYRTVMSVQPGSYQASSDMHEFKVIDDGKSALLTVYLRSVHDLCPFKICDGLGYIQQGAFQEVEVDTGKVLFEWRSLDHVDPSESIVLPGSTEVSGSGETPDSPWDYFHINSIDKNEDGDYLISARHVSCVYKISGKDGHVIWRLNGAKSDYELDGFNFGYQHDARFVSDNEDETVISLFDNAANGFSSTRDYSVGQIIKLHHKNKTATAIYELLPPFNDGHGHSSRSQGNFQRLPGGNMILGLGSDAYWSEYDPDGNLVFYGAIGWANVMNYRVHKFDNWIGLPLTKPALWIFSKTGSNEGTTMSYVSWNGATEVRRWDFYAGNSKSGPWKKIAEVKKNGFESIYKFEGFFQHAYAEAIDKNGKSLGKSEIQQTFVPNVQMLDYCDDLACRFVEQSEEREKQRQKEAEAQKKKEEEEEKERQRIAEERESEEAAARRRKVLLVSTLGTLAILMTVILVLSSRNFVSRPVNLLLARIWNLVRSKSMGGGRNSAGYKFLPLDDHDGDRMPMARHTS